MHHDEKFTRFSPSSPSLPAQCSAVIASSCCCCSCVGRSWGLRRMLIGFWYERPAAAAAAKKALITTRVGDLGLLLGMVWLYGKPARCSFMTAARMHGARPTRADGENLNRHCAPDLLRCGGEIGPAAAALWLPDAMEGPTPVSALIHAATMVAAGVYLVARVYPLMSASSNRSRWWPGLAL